MPRRWSRVLSLLLALAVGVAACGGDDDTAEDEPNGAASRDVGVAFEAAGLGDPPLTDAARLALLLAEDELGLTLHPFETDPTGSDRAELLGVLAQEGYGLVLAVGAAFAPAVADVAPDHPGVTFVLFDGLAPELPNVVSVAFADEQADYLAGAVAALVSASHRLALVGGQDGIRWDRARAGFRAGAIRIDPDVDIDEALAPASALGGVDVAQVQSVAAGLVGAGADVVYAVPGPATAGALAASQQHGGRAWVIGADLDRAELVDPAQAPLVKGSAVKDVAGVLQALLREYAEEGGLRAGVRLLGVADGAIDFEGALDPGQQRRLDELVQAMADGELAVPKVP